MTAGSGWQQKSWFYFPRGAAPLQTSPLSPEGLRPSKSPRFLSEELRPSKSPRFLSEELRPSKPPRVDFSILNSQLSILTGCPVRADS
jgi:hypothetical protein